jgi:lipopolysaccharide transport system permease protein
VTLLSSYRDNRELFVNLTLRELRSKYKRSFLGWAWSLVTPLATMAVYSIVFALFLRSRPAHGVHGLDVFALWLMCALLPWTFFSAGMMGAIGSVVSNGSLISKTYFDRRLLPASNIGAALVSHVIEMSLLVVVLLGVGDWEAVEYLPLVAVFMALTAVAAFGMGLMLSALNVYFRDVEHFMAIALMIWFYLTPIIYPIATAGRFAKFIKLNPMTEMTNCFRAVLYYGRLPSVVDVSYFGAFALAALVVGWVVFSRLQGGFAEEL